MVIYLAGLQSVSQEIYEAAEIDGASPLYIFFGMAVPLSAPAYITSFLFGLVWYWNETYISSLFLDSSDANMQLKLANFVSEYSQMGGSEQLVMLNEGVRLAATLLIILPMIIVYFTMQRWFVEGVEKTGITGE